VVCGDGVDLGDWDTWHQIDCGCFKIEHSRLHAALPCSAGKCRGLPPNLLAFNEQPVVCCLCAVGRLQRAGKHWWGSTGLFPFKPVELRVVLRSGKRNADWTQVGYVNGSNWMGLCEKCYHTRGQLWQISDLALHSLPTYPQCWVTCFCAVTKQSITLEVPTNPCVLRVSGIKPEVGKLLVRLAWGAEV
jgi:hypothetical protein